MVTFPASSHSFPFLLCSLFMCEPECFPWEDPIRTFFSGSDRKYKTFLSMTDGCLKVRKAALKDKGFGFKAWDRMQDFRKWSKGDWCFPARLVIMEETSQRCLLRLHVAAAQQWWSLWAVLKTLNDATIHLIFSNVVEWIQNAYSFRCKG